MELVYVLATWRLVVLAKEWELVDCHWFFQSLVSRWEEAFNLEALHRAR
jgi:hypothetical protein